ncbi:MAG: hypothetical protein LC800_14545 [Acidobacteria bacterium]|nr:hypothetical protein [Acidobacteriota bacterium]
MRSHTLTKLLLAALLLALPPARAGAARAGEPEYDAAVKLVETYYKAKHRGIPFIARAGVGVAKVISSDVRRAARYANARVAVFDDQDFTARGAGGEFHSLLRERLRPGRWSNLLSVRGAEEGQVYTFTKPDGGKFKVLIAVIEQRDAVVLQVDLNADEFAKLLSNPEAESRSLSRDATTADDK